MSLTVAGSARLRRFRSTWGLAAGWFAVAAVGGAGCDKFHFLGTGAPPDTGGIEIRCLVTHNASHLLPTADEPQDPSRRCLFEDTDTDDITLESQGIVKEPGLDSFGNVLGFDVDEPGCESITVDACVPNQIKLPSGTVEFFRLDIEKYKGDLTRLPPEAFQRIQTTCMLAAGYSLAETTHNPLDVKGLTQLAITFTQNEAPVWAHMIQSQTDMPLDPFTEMPYTGGHLFTTDIQTENACEPGYQDSDTNFPFFERDVWLQKSYHEPAGLAQVDPARSPLTVSVTDGSHDPSTAPSSAIGEILLDKNNCVGEGASKVCDLTVKYLRIGLQSFVVAHHTVTGAVLKNEGYAVGALIGSSVFIRPDGINLVGEFNLDNGDHGVVYFSNSEEVTGTWDVENNSFSLSVGLRGTSPDGSSASIDGMLGGQFLNRSPVPVQGPNQTLECAGPAGTPTTFDGSKSFDLDGKIAAYEWYGPDPSREPFAANVPFARTATTPATVPFGTHEYDLRVYDGWTWNDRETLSVDVVDTKPPAITVDQSPGCVWPPDHRLVRVDLGKELVAHATDVCTGDVTSSLRIVSVTSDEPVDGLGDGDTGPDVIVGKTGFCIRAERSGTGAGRNYVVTLQAEDGHGQTSTSTVTIAVPHDQGGGNSCAGLPEAAPGDCDFEGASAASNEALAATAPAAPSVPPVASQGCAIGGSSPTPAAFVFILLTLLLARVRNGTRLLVAALAVTGSFTACSSSTPAPTTHAALSIQFNGANPVGVDAAPSMFLQATNVSISGSQGAVRFFVGGPRSLFTTPGSVAVGTGADQIGVWALTGNSQPLTATSGTIVIQDVDTSATGHLTVQISGATHPADTMSGSMVMNGTISGKWSQPN